MNDFDETLPGPFEYDVKRMAASFTIAARNNGFSRAGSADVESMTLPALTFYSWTCGWTLARAHARSGDPVAIAACLDGSDAFDKSISDFAQRYADQNARDYQEFVTAIRSGRLEARNGM